MNGLNDIQNIVTFAFLTSNENCGLYNKYMQKKYLKRFKSLCTEMNIQGTSFAYWMTKNNTSAANLKKIIWQNDFPGHPKNHQNSNHFPHKLNHCRT